MAAGELELGPPESLDDRVLVPVKGPDGHQRLADVNASHGALGLAEGTPHSGLETIGAGTGQHFVDAQHMVGMDADPDVELILGRVLDHVLEQKYHTSIGFKWIENRFGFHGFCSEKN